MSDETAGRADEQRASLPSGTEPEPEARPETGPGTGPPAPVHDPAAPSPLGMERVPTGNPEVDENLARLGDADHLPADGHLDVYEDVHRGLRDALTALDVRPGPGQVAPRPGPAQPYDHRS
ncbi:hypothetical protein GCM10011583_74620 [Streptomyces camponoticapitis]|uniref:Uncharacterized protein n=1 Tax=Streptomyces camponoticapitis TaxID=1616125 RepID=A0ABQ2EYH3_9ACTN|nr:hypothetical protein [Streptomyces camponoticapitis]GGK31902.1 hypothetical protein GCM10011583_74620 [Streptomyces camponoticapitis]